jgi:hypothetical protein
MAKLLRFVLSSFALPFYFISFFLVMVVFSFTLQGVTLQNKISANKSFYYYHFLGVFLSSCSRVVLFYFSFVTFTYSIVIKNWRITIEPFIWSYLHTLKKVFSSFFWKTLCKNFVTQKREALKFYKLQAL